MFLLAETFSSGTDAVWMSSIQDWWALFCAGICSKTVGKNLSHVSGKIIDQLELQL
jgi:hypothetical protein